MSDARPDRRGRLLAELERRDLGALVVSHLPSVRWLTGYVGSNGVAVVGRGGTALLTDFRYEVSAREQVDPGCRLVMRKLDLLAGVPEVAGELSEGGRIGVEAAHLSWAQGDRLRAMLTEAGAPEAVPVTGVVEGLRMVKDAREIELIRASAAITDAALERALAGGLVGRTERELAWDIRVALHELGAEAPSFDTIVAAAGNGAKPHAVPGDQVIPEGTLVVVDMGAVHEGYCSDMTRTFATGELHPELRRAHEVCERAQLAALAAVRPGIGCGALDAVARDIIDEAGFGPAFGHSLGHGVGLEIHEGPRLAREAEGELRPGMVVTIEPGIYLEGIGGVRIEDLVVVTDDGCEILSGFPKEPAGGGPH